MIGNLHAPFYSFEVVYVMWVGAKGGQQFKVWGFFPASDLQLKTYPGDCKCPAVTELPMDLLHHK